MRWSIGLARRALSHPSPLHGRWKYSAFASTVQIVDVLPVKIVFALPALGLPNGAVLCL